MNTSTTRWTAFFVIVGIVAAALLGAPLSDEVKQWIGVMGTIAGGILASPLFGHTEKKTGGQ